MKRIEDRHPVDAFWLGVCSGALVIFVGCVIGLVLEMT